MATHSFGSDELQGLKSANAYRREIERVDRERREQAERASLKKEVSNAIKTPQKMLERELRSTINSDPIGRETRSGYLATSTVVNVVGGVALILASCAVESAYNKAIMSAQNQSNDDYKQEVARQADRYDKQLTEYANDVTDTRERLEATQQGRYADYMEAKDNANRAIETADKVYERDKAGLDKQERNADRSYKQEMDSLQSQMKQAETTRDSAIQSAKDKYESDVKHINETYSGAAKTEELQRAAARKDENIQRHADAYAQQHENLSKQMSSASAEHASAIASIQHGRSVAKDMHDRAVADANKQVEIAKNKYSEDVQKRKNEFNRADERLARFQGRPDQIGNAADAVSSLGAQGIKAAKQNGSPDEVAIVKRVQADEKAAMRAAKQGQEYTSKVTDNERALAKQITTKYSTAVAAAHSTDVTQQSRARQSNGAARYADAVAKSHSNVGLALVSQLGTDKEKDLVNRVQADHAAAAKAMQNGNKNYIPTTTKAEREQADKLIKSYAGDISNEKGIKKTIANYENAEKALALQKQQAHNALAKQQDELKAINAKIEKTKGTVDQLAADKKALHTNRDASGAKLTQKQRAEIAARVKAGGDMDSHSKMLTELTKNKNKLLKDIEKNQKQFDKANNALLEVGRHKQFLKKNGKAVADTITVHKPKITLCDRIFDGKNSKRKMEDYKEAKRNAGGSKAANKMGKKGVAMIFQSVNKISREFKKEVHKGNDIHKELMGNMRTAKKVADKYELALTVATFAPKVLMATSKVALKSMGNIVKVIGGKTRLGKALAEKWKTFALRHDKILSKINVGKIGRYGKNIGNGLLHAPSKILGAPMKLMSMPQDLAKKATTGAFRFTRRAVGRTVGGAAHLTKKSLRFVGRNTFGRMKWYQKSSAKLNAIKNRIKAVAQSAAKKVMAPVNWVKKKMGGIISALISALGTVIAWILGICAFVFVAMLLLLLILSAAAAAASALTSVFAAIAEWWNSIQAKTDSYVKNQPAFIANMAVNYRDAELQIFELFVDKDGSKAKDRIAVSTSPIYYSLYFAEDESKKGFLWFKDKEKPTIVVANPSAKTLLTNLSNSGNVKEWIDKKLPQEADIIIAKYDNVKLTYYPYSQYDPKTGNLKPNAVPSEYELSNAKDALAITDTLYTHDPNGMQLHEALAYLGVGEYQMATGGKTNYITNNLFWNTHKFIYRSGTSGSQVKFHNTSSNVTTYEGNSTKYHLVDGPCSNKRTISFKIDPGIGKSPISYKVEICQGHIDLDVAVVVTTMADGDAMFDAARNVAGLKEKAKHKSFLGIYTNDKVLKMDGLGHVTWYPYNPSADWAPESAFRETARAKTTGELTYTITNDQNVFKIGIIVRDKFPSLNQTAENVLLYGMFVDGKLYYVESFKTGEQKDLILHSEGNGKDTLDLICKNGKPYVDPH